MIYIQHHVLLVIQVERVNLFGSQKVLSNKCLVFRYFNIEVRNCSIAGTSLELKNTTMANKFVGEPSVTAWV